MITKITKIVIVFCIVVLSLLVRKKNFAQIPINGQSIDEYSYSWVGLSLIKIGVPVGISGIPGYEHQYSKYINVDQYMQVLPSDPLTINYPWMDHPPLLGLITGGYAYLKGAQVFEDTTASIIRKPIVIISSISVLLVMIFCWINFNFLTAVLSGLIYGTAPLVVLSSRMIQAENAIIPCLLMVMISLSLYLKKKKDFWIIFAAIISGLATLFKLTGVVCYLFTFLVLLTNYKKINSQFIKDYLFFLVISIPISLLFIVYGSVYGLDNFKNILFSNTNRFYGVGSNLILELIQNQRLTHHKFLPEVWVICGWIVSIAYLIKKPKKTSEIIPLLAILSYLIIYILSGSQPYGWYTFPFWPLLIIVLSRFLIIGFNKGKNLISVFLISIIIFGANISRLINVFEFQSFANYWRVGVSGMLFILISLSILKIKSKLLIKILLITLWTTAIYLNLKYLNNINIAYWWQNIS